MSQYSAKQKDEFLDAQYAQEAREYPDFLDLWRNPPDTENLEVIPGVAEIVTQAALPNVLNHLFYSEIQTAEMTNLGNILLGNKFDSDPSNDDFKMGRLSLAHENLTYIPKSLCDEFGPSIKILDITDNRIKDLEFLEYFTELTSLIADKNPINALETNVPWMPKLELLYLNHCRIDNIFWVESLKYNCPNLKYLSLMGNPVVPSFKTRQNLYLYLQYRCYVIAHIPTLLYLDDRKVTDDERGQSKKMYPTPMVQNLLKTGRARMPQYFRKLATRINDYFILKMNGNRKEITKTNVIV